MSLRWMQMNPTRKLLQSSFKDVARAGIFAEKGGLARSIESFRYYNFAYTISLDHMAIFALFPQKFSSA